MLKLTDQKLAEHAASVAIKEAHRLLLTRQMGKVPNWVHTSLPYLKAIRAEDYGLEDPAMCVLYALNNMTGWRGEMARTVKEQLNRSLK